MTSTTDGIRAGFPCAYCGRRFLSARAVDEHEDHCDEKAAWDDYEEAGPMDLEDQLDRLLEAS